MAFTQSSACVYSTTAGDALTGRKKISYIRWVNATAADHACIIKDTGGSVIWHSVADGANFLDIFPLFDWVNGIDIDTLTSGTIYIYII